MSTVPSPHGSSLPSSDTPPPGTGSPATAATWKTWLKRSAKLAIVAITLLALASPISQAVADIQRGDWRLRGEWVAFCAATYLAGLVLLGLPWWWVLRDRGIAVSLGPGITSYVISHVGKYVPGKAMAMVLRYMMLGNVGVTFALAVWASFYETFSTMATGSLVAAVCWWLLPLPDAYRLVASERPLFGMATVALAAGFLAAIVPPVFALASRLLTRAIIRRKPDATARAASESGPIVSFDQPIRWSTFFSSLLAGVLAWFCWGTSYWAALNAVAAEPISLSFWPPAMASMALSIVGGFVTLLPGQAVVREWVLTECWTPVVGAGPAVSASVLHRLVTLGVELGAAALLWPLLRRRNDTRDKE